MAPRAPSPLNSPRVLFWLVASAVMLIVFTALEFAVPGLVDPARPLQDFDAFFIAGRLALEGRLGDAYQSEAMFAALERILGKREFLLWSYPPHFNLITAPLALLPRWLGYLLFSSASLAGLLLAVRRLAPGHLPFVCLLLFPAIIVCLRTGQNGVMLGALLAAAMALLRDGRAVAGLPIALLTVKPHYLPAIGLWLLACRQWRVIGVAAAATAVLLAAATLVFNGVWPQFLASLRETSAFLAAGAFPLHRMISLYAALRSWGVAATPALAAQAALAAVWLAGLVWALRAGWPQHQQLAMAAMAALFLSPYGYDYDLPLLAAGVALLAPDLAARASRGQQWLALVLCWTAAGFGAALTPYALSGAGHRPPALAVYTLLPACVLLLWLVRRPLPGALSGPAVACMPVAFGPPAAFGPDQRAARRQF